MEYQLIRSRRKTLEICVKPGGILVVRAPMRLPKTDIEKFLAKKEKWILEKQQKLKDISSAKEYSPEETAEMKRKTLQLVTPRVSHFAALIGVTPTGIRVTEAKKRWGSCTAKNSLNFSFLLAEKPAVFIDSVVIHELCHIIYHNHSREFWELVQKYDTHFPGKRPG